MVSYFKKFEVLDFDPVYSDVDCGLSFEISSMLECNHLRPDKTESANDSKQCRFVTKWPRWLNDFVQNTDKEKLENIENILLRC